MERDDWKGYLDLQEMVVDNGGRGLKMGMQVLVICRGRWLKVDWMDNQDKQIRATSKRGLE
jgi:hypothetical protein